MILVVKNPPSNAGDAGCEGSIRGSGRSPGEGNGHPLRSMGSQRVRHDLVTEQQPVFLPGECHGQQSLVGYSPWGPRELETTEQLNTHIAEISK